MLLPSCRQQTVKETHAIQGREVSVKYARGFRIQDFENYLKLTVRNPLDTSLILDTYILYRDKNFGTGKFQEMHCIQIPVQNIACLSTTHVGFLEALHLEDKIVACSGTQYLYNDKISDLVKSGNIKEMGAEGSLNTELLVTLHPSIIMAYNMGDPSYDQFDKLLSLQMMPVLNNEYLETSPLGQAEWIKFTAAFFNELDAADNIFDSITTEYEKVKSTVAQITDKPDVFTGMAFKGEWTIPGGKSFAAHYLADAGADYIWKDDTKTGNYPVALEEVIAKAKDADFWLHAGAAENLHNIRSADERYKVFSAFQHENIFNNNNRVNAAGGNDYWESGVISPHIVLKDLVRIFHPDVLPEHELVYYKQLH